MMRLLRALSLFALSSLLYAQPATLRVDYYHTGNSKQEYFSLDRLVLEPLPWPGNPAKSIDDTNLGNYLFEVHDLASDRLLYSRGFSSIFAEWATTEEAEHTNRSFSESFRFPQPSAPVHIVLKERQDGVFHAVWSVDVDPSDKFIDNSKPPSPGPLLKIVDSGNPATKVDLLVLGPRRRRLDEVESPLDVGRDRAGLGPVFARGLRPLPGLLAGRSRLRSRVRGWCDPDDAGKHDDARGIRARRQARRDHGDAGVRGRVHDPPAGLSVSTPVSGSE